MRGIATAQGATPGFSFGGTLTVVFLGALAGLTAGLVYVAARMLLPRRVWWARALFTVILLATTLRGLRPIDALRLQLFLPLFLVFGVALDRLWERRSQQFGSNPSSFRRRSIPMSHNHTGVVSPESPSVQTPSASKLVGGDGRMLGAFYDRFGPLAYSLAFSITGRPADAEHIVSTAFATTWHSMRHGASSSAFFAALMTTVRADALSSRSRVRSLPDVVATSSLADRPRAAVLSSDATGTAVAIALSALPETQRRALMLAYFDGLSIGEIASELHEPIEHVKANLHAALRHLRSGLAESTTSAGLV